MTVIEITLKLLLAVALGGLIGLERESSQKPAGFRTNILICTAASMMMILARLIFLDTGMEGSELARIAAGVITGIGFIGAGTIIQARGSVTGLTTAATLWVVAVLGLVIGAGHYLAAVIFTGIVILTLIIFRRIEEQHMHRRQSRYRITVQESREVLFGIKNIALHEGLKFRNLSLKKKEDHTLIEFSFHPNEEREKKFRDSIINLDGILEIVID